MAESFNSANVKLTTTNPTDIYQCPPSYLDNRSIILSLLVANVDGTANDAITITITDSARNVVSTLASTISVPADASLEVIANKVILRGGQIIQATAGTANALEVTLSAMEVTV